MIGLSAYAEPHYVEAMLDAGAVGHFTKGDVGDALLRAIHEATAAQPRFGANIVNPASGVVPPAIVPGAAAGVRSLGARETEVLRLIARGRDHRRRSRARSRSRRRWSTSIAATSCAS